MPTYFNVTSSGGSGATTTAYVNMVNAALDRAISSGDLASILAIIRVASLVRLTPRARAPRKTIENSVVCAYPAAAAAFAR